MMTILGMDTTSRYASISVAKDNEICLEYNFTTQDDLSATLIPSIELVLNSLKLKLEDVDVFAVTTGPGRFTGIRVGLSTMKGLLLKGEKPIVAVDTLTTLAWKSNNSEIPVLAMIDAKREEVYVAGFRFVLPGEMEEWIAPGLVNINELPGYLERMVPGSKDLEMRLTGSGAEAYKNIYIKHLPRAKISRRSFFLASELCQLAYRRFKNNDYIQDLQQLVPFYIRKPDAEQNFQRQLDKASS